MSRIFLLPLIAAPLLAASLSCAAPITRGNLVFDGVPEQPLDSAAALDAYLSARGARPLGFTPKGQLLIATRFDDVDQLHLVERAGADRRQITFLREPIQQAAFSPDPSRNAYFYLKDAAGDGITQIYYQHMGEIAARRLTDGKSLNGGAVWSNAGHEIAFFTTARDGVSFDIDIVDPEGGGLPRLAVTGDGTPWYPLDWSGDDRKLLVRKHVSDAEDYLYVVDLSTGQKREVDPSPSKVAITGARFSRDGTGVYFISDRDSEFKKLRYVNLFTADKTEVSAPIPWDVEQFALSRDGHYLAYVSNQGGTDYLSLLDLRAHQDLIPPNLPMAGVIDSLSFDLDSKRLAFGLSAANQPRDAYVLDMEANRLEAWTRSESGPIDRTKFIVPRLSQFPTFDRTDGRSRQIPLYIYEPPGPGPHPVLIILHGGPESQFRPGFDPWIQYVVNELRFAVLAPNVRGSSGYGKTFASLDDGMLREDAVKDIGALLVWLSLDPRFDAKHVVISGTGYGGSLALAALVNYGERLRGAVDFAGITDFIGFLSNAPPYRQSELRAEFGDERDPDTRAYLRRISPLTNTERINRPVLAVHGKNDTYVPISQSDLIVNQLRVRAGGVWYLKALDEGHRFERQQSRDAYCRTFAQFLISLR
jgi:dipeptidyl aminopeptidase/acylaminoacyl peptidase